MLNKNSGSFTLPGEAGYENLTLELAKKWGADVIRDSDGTQLSDEIINAGYGIYSTICIIRNHNAWAKKNLDKLQQCFLITDPVLATENYIQIRLMDTFFEEQFRVNDTLEALNYWQVYDRTTNEEVGRLQWTYDSEKGQVIIENAIPWHRYTVSFMAYRVWEEISMYNHTTNNWDQEHLMQIDPMYPETQAYLLDWMERWCKEHPETTVVRFTSMFYNFVWIWGNDLKNRHRFTDWGSYDFTVSVRALELFEKKHGYTMCAEDFVNGGKFHVSHMPSTKRKSDWIEFINDFVIDFGKKLIDMVHDYDKAAYMFYDDSWVGTEPYNDRFKEFGFDGMIKCVFSGFEARLCSGVDVETHEIRLHPYLFPVGLGGKPTFMEGGNPTLDAKNYWINIRRALLREKIDRIGLGGYLHLVESYPDFCDYIEKISDEFRSIKDLHQAGKPYTIKAKVAVLHSWGKERSWTLSGHFHETDVHDLIHINEALSGLPVDVTFIDFNDIKKGILHDVDVIINAGYAGSAWSGGEHWRDDALVETLTEWTYNGGVFIGVNEPSAVSGYDNYFRMGHVLGVYPDLGDYVSHGKWQFEEESIEGFIPTGASIKTKDNIYLTDGQAQVVKSEEDQLQYTINKFGQGKGIYMPSFRHTLENTRMLLNSIRLASGEWDEDAYLTDNLYTECAYYPESQILVTINNSDKPQKTRVKTSQGFEVFELEPFDTIIRKLNS
jgi:beta-D-galactosyl-(1->4)-L-rhamnose phosphorylase